MNEACEDCVGRAGVSHADAAAVAGIPRTLKCAAVSRESKGKRTGKRFRPNDERRAETISIL